MYIMCVDSATLVIVSKQGSASEILFVVCGLTVGGLEEWHLPGWGFAGKVVRYL